MLFMSPKRNTLSATLSQEQPDLLHYPVNLRDLRKEQNEDVCNRVMMKVIFFFIPRITFCSRATEIDLEKMTLLLLYSEGWVEHEIIEDLKDDLVTCNSDI